MARLTGENMVMAEQICQGETGCGGRRFPAGQGRCGVRGRAWAMRHLGVGRVPPATRRVRGPSADAAAAKAGQ